MRHRLAPADLALLGDLTAAGYPVVELLAEYLGGVDAAATRTGRPALDLRSDLLTGLAMLHRGAGLAVEAMTGPDTAPAWIDPCVARLWLELGRLTPPRSSYLVREIGDDDVVLEVTLEDGRRLQQRLQWPKGMAQAVRDVLAARERLCRAGVSHL